MKNEEKSLLELFSVFLKIGAFTFGGGYAMIPLIQKEIVDKRHWITDDDILDIIAIAESTPGPIAVNSATFVGYHVAGFWGAFTATTGVVLPSFFIILAISFVLPIFEANQYVKYAFFGVRAGVLALILSACLSMYKRSPKDAISILLMGFAFVVVAVFKINAVYVIIACAIVGLLSGMVAERRIKR